MAKPDQLFGGARSALCEFFSLTFYLGNSKQFSYGLGLECPLFCFLIFFFLNQKAKPPFRIHRELGKICTIDT